MHPCAKKTGKPSWCTKKKTSKRKSSRKGKMTCACPSGWEKKGIMCKRGSTFKRASCRKKR